MVWESAGSAGGDTSGYSVQGKIYDANGSPISGEFQVNTYTTNNQVRPSVVSDPNGTKFVVVWLSKGSPSNNLSQYSVQGQRYLPEPSFLPCIGSMIAMLLVLARRR